MITPKQIHWFLGGLVMVGFLTYLGFEVLAFARSPLLILEVPREDLTVEEASLTIKGTTSRDSRLFINREEVSVNDKGYFEEKINLQPGLNILNFEAVNRAGKRTYVQRKVIRE
jgi:hypothetical protein